MNKQILSEYIDACGLIAETEQDIERLKKKQKTIHQASVSGSNPEFPYEKKHFHVEGKRISIEDDNKLRHEQQLLEERKKNAENIKLQVQQFLNTLPPRMQRIIRMRYFEGNSWEEVANTLGRNATADSVRMELERFLKEK